MNDVRVFEATLQRCVERHRRVYLVAQIVFGLFVLGCAVSTVRSSVAVIFFTTGPFLRLALGDDVADGLILQVVGHVGDEFPTLSRWLSFGYYGAAAEEPAALATGLGFVVVTQQLFSTGRWLLIVVFIHVLKSLFLVAHPQAYVQSMNAALWSTFGF